MFIQSNALEVLQIAMTNVKDIYTAHLFPSFTLN